MGEIMVAKEEKTAADSLIPVNTYAEAQDNALRFQEYLKSNETLRGKLSQYTHWYYFEQKDIFAPSKFIGYKKNTYHSESAHEGDGRETEKALAKFFRKLLPSPEQPDLYVIELYAKLAAMLRQYGKKPKSGAVIHVARENQTKKR